MPNWHYLFFKDYDRVYPKKEGTLMKDFIQKHIKIISILVVIIIFIVIYLLYNFIINPKDEFGSRCQTLYNQSQYKLITGDTIDIPESSCFVSECCSYVATFRTKMNEEDLKKQLAELEQELNATYTNLDFKTSSKKHKLYNSYTITYSYKG